jgi:leader peptidase (prepilin peptidase)/N-methyltransferase
MQLTPAVVILGAAAVMAFGVRPVLERLPEPADGDGKPLYRELATTRFVAVTSALAALGVTISQLSLGREVQPLWWVLAVFGVLLAAIDARTTWLPLILTRFAWLAMALMTVSAAVLAADWWLLARSVGGAAAAGSLYLIVWFAARGGFGFGDVRFAPLIGAATAAYSADLLIWALLLGSLAGGILGSYRLLVRRPGSFAYAPAMLFGGYAACVIERLS